MFCLLSKSQHAHLQSIQRGKGLRNFNEALEWALELAAEPFMEENALRIEKDREHRRELWKKHKANTKQREAHPRY